MISNKERIAIAKKQIKTVEAVEQKFQQLMSEWEDVNGYFVIHFKNYAAIFADTKEQLSQSIDSWGNESNLHCNNK